MIPADAVGIVEMAPRDGLQNESAVLSTADKVELVERAVRAGARRIEVTSFVNPARVPQMADADELMAALPAPDGVSYAGLVMNDRGLDRALAAGVRRGRRRGRRDRHVLPAQPGRHHRGGLPAGGLARRPGPRGRRATTVTIGAAFGCPFEGEVPEERLREVLGRVADAGPDELALADTIGVAVPSQVSSRLALAAEVAGADVPLRLHLHDTRHTGVANAVAAHAAGVRTLDASIGGTGGCPFAPNATGNVATEDLVYLFDRMGVSTGLDLATTTATTAWLEERLGKRLPGALLSRRFPAPAR